MMMMIWTMVVIHSQPDSSVQSGMIEGDQIPRTREMGGFVDWSRWHIISNQFRSQLRSPLLLWLLFLLALVLPSLLRSLLLGQTAVSGWMDGQGVAGECFAKLRTLHPSS